MKLIVILKLVVITTFVSNLAIGSESNKLPSEKLLNSLNISSYSVTSELIVTVGNNGECNNHMLLPIKTLGKFNGVTSIYAAIENRKSNKVKTLFKVSNLGGVSETNAFFATHLQIPEFNDGTVSDIWVFMETPSGIYSNSEEIVCSVVQ